MSRRPNSDYWFSSNTIYNFAYTPCIPLMQLNMLRHRLMQHFTRVGGNEERYVDDHVSFIGINVRMSGS